MNEKAKKGLKALADVLLAGGLAGVGAYALSKVDVSANARTGILGGVGAVGIVAGRMMDNQAVHAAGAGMVGAAGVPLVQKVTETATVQQVLNQLQGTSTTGTSTGTSTTSGTGTTSGTAGQLAAGTTGSSGAAWYDERAGRFVY